MFAVCIYGIKFRVGSVGGWKVEGRWVAFGVAVGRALCGEETIFKISYLSFQSILIPFLQNLIRKRTRI